MKKKIEKKKSMPLIDGELGIALIWEGETKNMITKKKRKPNNFFIFYFPVLIKIQKPNY